jgi:hypothetical protein
MTNFLDGVLGGRKNAHDLEPQRSNNALLHINDVPGAGSDNELVLSLSSFPIPKSNNGVVELAYLNEKRKFAGNPTFDDLSVIFKDYVNKGVADALLQWRQQVYNPHNGTIGFKKVYAKTGFVQLFAPDGTGVRHYNLFGVWPSTYDPGDIDMAGEDTINITVTLTIDKAVPAEGFGAANPATKGAAGGGSTSDRGAPIRSAGTAPSGTIA